MGKCNIPTLERAKNEIHCYDRDVKQARRREATAKAKLAAAVRTIKELKAENAMLNEKLSKTQDDNNDTNTKNNIEFLLKKIAGLEHDSKIFKAFMRSTKQIIQTKRLRRPFVRGSNISTQDNTNNTVKNRETSTQTSEQQNEENTRGNNKQTSQQEQNNISVVNTPQTSRSFSTQQNTNNTVKNRETSTQTAAQQNEENTRGYNKQTSQQEQNNISVETTPELSRQASDPKTAPIVGDIWTNPESRTKMEAYISTILPSKYLPLQWVSAVCDHGRIRITVLYANKPLILFIDPDMCVLTNEDSTESYSLAKIISSNNTALKLLCPEMQYGFIAWIEEMQYQFYAKRDLTARVTVLDPLDPADSIIILPDRTRSTQEDHFIAIKKALRAEVNRLLSIKSGVSFDWDDNDDIIVINTGRDMDKTRSEVELAEALLDAYPDLIKRLRFINGDIYHHDLKTNIWFWANDTQSRAFYRPSLRKLQLTREESRNIAKNWVIDLIAFIIENEFVEKVTNKEFNSMFHNFVTKGKVIDVSSIPPRIRDIHMEDFIIRTSEWKYEPELARKHMVAVNTFLDEIFPMPRERNWFLSFAARLLNGNRSDESFVILTDKQPGGKSGKSGLINLLRCVFGSYSMTINDGTLIDKESRTYDENSTELYALHGKRLLLAEKSMKNKPLDCDSIKRITSSNYCITLEEDYRVVIVSSKDDDAKGNVYPLREGHTFRLQAGLIVGCSKDYMRKIDANDEDFLKRMIVCPMRSKFLSRKVLQEKAQNGEYVTDTFEASKSFPYAEYRSAMLDILIAHYKESLPPIPDSMRDLKKNLFTKNSDSGKPIKKRKVPTDSSCSCSASSTMKSKRR